MIKTGSKDFIRLSLVASNFLLFIAVVGLFLYVHNVQNQINIIFSAVISQTNSVEAVAQEYEGAIAANFDLQIVGSEARAALTDFQGTPVLLAFTWTECIYCKAMYPELLEFSKVYPDIRVLMISRGTQEANQELIEEHDFTFPVLEGDDIVYANYLIPGTPFFYYISEEGYIKTVFYANTFEDFERLLINSG